MIDSRASNSAIPFRIMEAFSSKVDTNKGICRAMDAREVPLIGTINSLSFKLATYPDVDLNVTVQIVSIPP